MARQCAINSGFRLLAEEKILDRKDPGQLCLGSPQEGLRALGSWVHGLQEIGRTYGHGALLGNFDQAG